MSDTYFLVGQYLNHLVQIAAPGYVTPESYDTNYPTANLYDGKPYSPFKFSTYATSGYIEMNLNVLGNGGAEAAYASTNTPSAWTSYCAWGLSSGCTLERTNAKADPGDPAGGTYSHKLTPNAANDMTVVEALVVPTGSRWRFTGACLGDGTNVARIYIYNRDTGHFYDPATDTWGDATAYMATTSSNVTWATFAETIEIEGWAASGYRDTVRIAVACQSVAGSGAGAAKYFDSLAAYPLPTFCALLGHNVPGHTVLTVKSGTTSPGTTNTRATFAAPVTRPSAFVTWAETTDRILRLSFSTTPSAAQPKVWIGELILGQHRTFTPTVSGMTTGFYYPQTRGPLTATAVGVDRMRQSKLTVKLFTDAHWAMLDEIMARSRSGAYPLVLVPDSADAASAMLGRISPMQEFARKTLTRRDVTLEFQELPYPIVL